MRKPLAHYALVLVFIGFAVATVSCSRNPWSVVDSSDTSEVPPRTWPQRGPHGVVVGFEVLRHFRVPGTDFHALIATYRAGEQHYRTAYGQLRGRVTFRYYEPELPDQPRVEAFMGAWGEPQVYRWHYLAMGWVNCPDVQYFTLKISDGHEVRLNAEEHEFFILYKETIRHQWVPTIEEIVIED